MRVPAGMRDHERAEGEERREHLEQLGVGARGEIAVEERVEQRAKGLGNPVATSRRALLQSEEEVVDGERADVIRRLTPLAAAPIEHREIRALLEQQVPGMEVAVHA